jgi:hypothetical protein
VSDKKSGGKTILRDGRAMTDADDLNLNRLVGRMVGHLCWPLGRYWPLRRAWPLARKCHACEATIKDVSSTTRAYFMAFVAELAVRDDPPHA